jgi:hypothetical protein
MDERKVLIIGGGGRGLEQAVIALLKQKYQQIIIVDIPNPFNMKARQNVHNKLLDLEKLGFNQTNFTPEREYDWYHCFNKRNKKRNLKIK